MLTILPNLSSQVLNGRTHAFAMCWKITTTRGDILRFTDWPHQLSLKEDDSPTTYDYTPTDGADTTARRREGELEADNKEVRGVLSSTAISTADLRGGVYDGAQIDEWLVDARVAWMGYIEHNRYWIRSVAYDNGMWRAQLGGMADMLTKAVGDVWQPTCRVPLFSTKCGLTKASYIRAHTVGSVPTTRKVIICTATLDTGPWQFDGYADDGTIEWQTGNNAGLVSEIKRHYNSGTTFGSFELHLPTPFDITAGDTFNAYPGCNKKSGIAKSVEGAAGDCKNKFNNLINFQGEPYIPGRDRAIRGID